MSMGENGILQKLTGDGLSVLKQSGTKIKFRSNITPEIETDLAYLLQGKEQKPAKPGLTMRLLRPKATVRALGVSEVYAPYGEPFPNAWLMLLLGAAAFAMIGAKIGLTMCRNMG